MATDKNGRELKVGDEVWLRATVDKVYDALEEAEATIAVRLGDSDSLFYTTTDTLAVLVEAQPLVDTATVPSAELKGFFGSRFKRVD